MQSLLPPKLNDRWKLILPCSSLTFRGTICRIVPLYSCYGRLCNEASSPTDERLLLSCVGDAPKEVLAHNGVSYAMEIDHDLSLALPQSFQFATLRAHMFQDGQPRVSFLRSSIVKDTVRLEW